MAHATIANHGNLIAEQQFKDEFPCRITLCIPFPTSHLADIAARALAVDAELSPLVRRTIRAGYRSRESNSEDGDVDKNEENGDGKDAVLIVRYRATTDRMLRVAVNSFMDTLALVVDVMAGLDADVVESLVQEHKRMGQAVEGEATTTAVEVGESGPVCCQP